MDRYGHSCTLMNGINLVLFGGWNGIDFFNDVYVLNLEVMAWTKPNCNGPAPCAR
jgi:host cell factor